MLNLQYLKIHKYVNDILDGTRLTIVDEGFGTIEDNVVRIIASEEEKKLRVINEFLSIDMNVAMRIIPFTSFTFIESIPHMVRTRIETLRGMERHKKDKIKNYADQILKEGSIKIENCSESHD